MITIFRSLHFLTRSDKDLKELKSEQKQIQDEATLQNFKLKLEQELEMSKINAAVNDELVQKTKRKLELLQKEHESLKLLENLARHSLEQNTIALKGFFFFI